MVFLLRAAFWLGLVLVVLPTGASKPPPGATEIGAVEAASAATAAMADFSRFCTRQPGACDTGSQIAGVLGQRMQAGAKMIYQFLTARGEATTAAKRNEGDMAPRNVVAEVRYSDRSDTTGSVAAKRAVGTIPASLIPRPRPPQSHDTLNVNDRQPAWRGPVLRQEARLRQPG